MNILVVAPHLDDEVLGAGGTICRHVQEGDTVHVCFMADRVYGHKLEAEKTRADRAGARRAADILGIAELTFLGLPDERLDVCIQDILIPLEACFRRTDPDWLYVCHGGDLNQDHRATFIAAMIAARPAANARLSRVLCYEVPSSTEQAPKTSGTAFAANCFIDISAHLERKIEALCCYSGEMRPFPHPRSPEGLRILAGMRGMEANLPAAEAFMILREIVR